MHAAFLILFLSLFPAISWAQPCADITDYIVYISGSENEMPCEVDGEVVSAPEENVEIFDAGDDNTPVVIQGNGYYEIDIEEGGFYSFE